MRSFVKESGRVKTGFRFDVEAWETERHRENRYRYPRSEWGRHGLLWTREAHNMVPTIGAKQLLINSFLAGGETAITSWFVSLIAATTGQQTTGGMTAASAVLTLATAFGTTPVVGQAITVFGAGASGGNLVTTVLSGSGTSWTLNANAGTTVSGAVCVLGPAFVAGDTSASHAGWVEATLAQVTQTVRSAFTVAVVGTSGVNATKTNSGSPAPYTGNTPNWYMTGLFIASTDVIGSTTDVLMSEAAFDSAATPPGAALIQNALALSITATMTMTAA